MPRSTKPAVSKLVRIRPSLIVDKVWGNRSTYATYILAVLLLCLTPHLTHATPGNAPVGGGGSCSYSTESDGTVAQQQPYDNGLYTCLSSGATWTPEALILGDTMANGSAATCSSTTAGMLIWTGAAVEFCNGTSFTSFGSLNPGSGTLGATSGVLVELSAGTAAAPSLTFYEDTQTGLYQPALHTIAITTNGTESGVFDGSGNFNLVGASAAYELDSYKILTVPAADTVYSLAVGNGALAGDSHTTGTTGEYNSAVGYDALHANTTGYNNTAFGDYALEYATTATQNTAVGDYALQGVSTTPLTGSNNTAVGYEALMSAYGSTNAMTAIGALALKTPSAATVDDTAAGYAALQTDSSAGSNTAVGYEAMMTTGSVDNVGIGYQALHDTTGGSGNNVAIGYQAMNSATSGAYNVAIGTAAMYHATGSDSVAVGYEALASWTGVGPMTAVGWEALNAATTATNDDALGYWAGSGITTGSSNMAIGDWAMAGYAVTPMTGTGYNTAIGDAALGYLSGTAAYNTAVGMNAMNTSSNTTGSNNTAVGYEALQNITSGGSNTAVGMQALDGLATGSYNTAVGISAMYSLEGAAARNTGVGSGVDVNANGGVTDNTLAGNYAGAAVTGNYNILVGESQQISSGSSNIVIGNNSLSQITGTSSSQIDIGDNIVVYANTHLAVHSAAPTIHATCPTNTTGASVVGNDNNMVITQGSGAATTTLCVVKFATAWVSTPVCVVTWGDSTHPASVLSAYDTSTTLLTIYGSTAETGKTINVTCMGYK